MSFITYAASITSVSVMFAACQSNPNCTNSDVSGVCATHTYCKTNWPEDPKAFCGGGGNWSIGKCGGYRFAEISFIDFGNRFFYDGNSGELVAITNFGNSGAACSAGPEDFQSPQCTYAVLDCAPKDAGTNDASGDQ